MKFILFFILLTVSLEANYCIQVKSTFPSEKDLLIREIKSDKYNIFSDVRIESRKPYLVFRIGNYKKYKDALNDIFKIRSLHNDAFIRKCDLLQDNILYIKNETYRDKDEKTQKEYVQENFKSVEALVASNQKAIIKANEEVKQVEETGLEQLHNEPIVKEDQQKEKKQTEIATVVPVVVKKVDSSNDMQAEYNTFEALRKAYVSSNEGNQTAAYYFFNEAIDKSSDASIYNKACKGTILYAPLRRKNIADPYYVTLYGTVMWYERAYQPETVFQKNFNDTVYQLKIRVGRYMDDNKTISLYFFTHLDGDVNSKAGSVPVIYSDNYTGIGIGADYRLSPYLRLFFETSFENNLIHNKGVDNTQFDYRAGLAFYKRWGPATNLSCSYKPTMSLKWFSDLYAAAVFYSRYNNNVILQTSGRLGVQLLTYRMSTLGIYTYAGVTADANGDYFNNIIETGPGLEYKPYQPIPFAIRSEYRFSKFLKNVPNGATDRFNTLLIYGIFYFEQ